MSSTIFVLLILPLLVGVDDCDAIPDDASYPSSLCVLEEEEEEEEEEEDANHRKHKEKKTVLFSVKLLSRVVLFVVVCAKKDFDAAL
jgi:hypothetical protein